MPVFLDPSLYAWNPWAVPWTVLGTLLVALTVVIFVRQRASRVAVLFCAMILLVGVWFLGFAAMTAALNAETAEVAARIALAGVCFLPAAIHDFTMTALRITSRKAAVTVAWLTAIAFALVTLFSHGIVGSVRLHRWGWYPVAGTFVPPFLVVFIGALGIQLVEGLAELNRTTDPARRKRIARLMGSFVVVYFGAIDFVPMFGANMPPVGYLPVLAFIVVAWNPIRRHRLPAITAAQAAREILDTMADALFVIDAEGRIRVVNGAVRALVGFEPADLLGKSIDTLEETSGIHTISRTLRELARRGPIRDQERLLRQKSGGSIPVSVSISPIASRDPQAGGAVVIARDIRERKRADEELRASAARLAQSNRELEDFAYVASHDLQEPLRKIQAFGDLLKSKHASALPDQGRDYVDRMQSAAKRMQVLINDLLAFSRVTTKAQPFAPVNLTEIAREVAHDLEVRTQETNAEIDIGELPVVEADPLQMRQLLQNLIGNALKFHRDGVAPRIEIAAEVWSDRALLTVRDNGIGFEDKYADRIFTMFERLHARGAYDGTGIGLAICRKIAERHGGGITARGMPGEGATFTVTLPLHHEQQGNSNA